MIGNDRAGEEDQATMDIIRSIFVNPATLRFEAVELPDEWIGMIGAATKTGQLGFECQRDRSLINQGSTKDANGQLMENLLTLTFNTSLKTDHIIWVRMNFQSSSGASARNSSTGPN
jgi:hypothetical protein